MTRRRRLALLLIVPLVALGLDLARAPDRQLSARVLLAGIGAYRAHGSPLVRRLGVRCRFEPSCSRYAELVVARDGALLGSLRAGWRILRCGPWTPRGTRDQP
jgi:putative component of membrane protein insertase Oxa1/YidC/SpoIIIJ protein YidD